MSLRLLPSLALLSLLLPACGDSSSTTPAGAAGASPDSGAEEEAGTDAAGADSDVPDVQGPDASDAGPDVESPDAESSDAAVDAQPDGAGGACSWAVSVVDAQPAFKARVAAAVGADGEPQLAYNVATSADAWYTPAVWHASRSGNTWVTSLAADAQGRSNEYPVIALDSHDRAQLFYNRYLPAEDQIDVFFTSDQGAGSFSAPVALTAGSPQDEYAPSVATDSQGGHHVLFQTRMAKAGQPGEYDYGIGFALLDGAQPSAVETVASGTVMFSLSPDYDVAVDGAGDTHVVYCLPGDGQLNNVLYYRRRSAGTWGTETRLSETDQDVWGPSLAVDGAGTVHVAYTIGPDWSTKTLSYDRMVGGVWEGARALTSSTEDRSYYLGLQASADGTVHIAFHRFYNSNGEVLYLRGKDGAFGPEERLTDTPDGDEGDTGVALGPSGEVYVSFVENLADAPNGKVYLAERSCP